MNNKTSFLAKLKGNVGAKECAKVIWSLEALNWVRSDIWLLDIVIREEK